METFIEQYKGQIAGGLIGLGFSLIFDKTSKAMGATLVLLAGLMLLDALR